MSLLLSALSGEDRTFGPGSDSSVWGDIRTLWVPRGGMPVKDLLDLSKPVALSLVGVFHYLPDALEPYELVKQLVEPLAPGSLLIFSHCTPDFAPDLWERAIQVYKADGGDAQVRSKEEVTRFFDGLELVEPGVSAPFRWHPDAETEALVAKDELNDVMCSLWVGVARKP